jgi:hypothetical protein
MMVYLMTNELKAIWDRHVITAIVAGCDQKQAERIATERIRQAQAKPAVTATVTRS